MKLFLWIAAAAALVAGIWWFAAHRNSLPEVTFVKPRRETLASSLPTNAKVEPIEWAPIHAQSPGLVLKLNVKLGDSVLKDAVIARISDPGLAEQLNAAQARTAEIQSGLDTLSKGGRNSEVAEIESSLAKSKFERDIEQNDVNSLKRLYEKQAATMVDVQIARNKLRSSELEIEALERRRTALVGKDDLAGARARLQEAQASQRVAESRLAQGVSRAPVGGVIYNLPARLGAFLNLGDLVADVGRIDRLRIRVFVDEPELGRVAVGQPVKITWDALPGKSWTGKVERLPAEIVPLGTRQVGEVLCTIENPNGELAPGANVNAAIETSLVRNALTIPKEALHLDNADASVFVLEGGNTVRLRFVKHGSDSITRAQISAGLNDGEWVALPSETVLKDGLKVKPLLQQ